MAVRLLVALTTVQEAHFVTTVGGSAGIGIARRCADVADLLAAAHAGLGTHAALSPDLPQLDREVVGQLTRHRLGLIGVVTPADEAGERRLRQLGVERVITGDADLPVIEAALRDVGADRGGVRGAGGAGGAGSAGGAGATGAAGAARAARPGDPGDTRDPVAALLGDPGAALLGGDDAALDARIDAALDGDLSALRTGAGDVVGDGQDLDADDVDDGPKRAQVLAVWGPIGSPGRTTVAVNLAAECAAGGLRALLIDADTYGASVAQHLGLLDDTPGLAAAARAAEQGALDAPGLLRRATEVSPRLHVLTGLPRADRWPEVRDAAMGNILDAARLVADVVVVDCGFGLEADEELSYDTLAPRRNATTLTTLGAADHLIVVGAGDPVGLQRLVQGLAELAHVPSPTPRVIVNKVRASAAGPHPERAIREVLGRFSGLDDVALVPDDRDACDAAMLAGRTLTEHAPGSRARTAIAEAARTVLPQLSAAATTRRALRRRR